MDGPFLVVHIRREMERTSCGCAVSKQIVEVLAVSEIKSQFLQPAFHAPIHFCHKIRPGTAAVASVQNSREGAGEPVRNLLQVFEKTFREHEHGHVAANAIAMLRDILKFPREARPGRRDQTRLIGPSPATGENTDRARGQRLKVRRHFFRPDKNQTDCYETAVRFPGCNIPDVPRPRGDPVQCGWEQNPGSVRFCGHEVFHAPHPDRPRCQYADRENNCESNTAIPPPGPASNRAGRDHIAGKAMIRFERFLRPITTTLPDTHQPDEVKSQARKLVPIAIRDVSERQFASIAPGKGFQPHPGIDFIEVRMGAQRELLDVIGWAVHGVREG